MTFVENSLVQLLGVFLTVFYLDFLSLKFMVDLTGKMRHRLQHIIAYLPDARLYIKPIELVHFVLSDQFFNLFLLGQVRQIDRLITFFVIYKWTVLPIRDKFFIIVIFGCR